MSLWDDFNSDDFEDFDGLEMTYEELSALCIAVISQCQKLQDRNTYLMACNKGLENEIAGLLERIHSGIVEARSIGRN